MLQTDPEQQRVFIVGEGKLLEDAVGHLLSSRRPNFIVSQVIYSNDFAFMDTIASAQPDVILICESEALDTVHILDLVSAHPIVARLRIIVIRLRNNVIDIYAEIKLVAGKISCNLRKITVRHEDDLLNAFVC